MKDTFAFLIHPINPKRDVARKYPLLGKWLPVSTIDFLCAFFPPVYLSKITGVRSEATGKEVEGLLYACPYTPRRMLSLSAETVYRKVVRAGRMAQGRGARILGLGAFNSVVGDGGLAVARRLGYPVTTGNSYTAAVALDTTLEAARRMDIPLSEATAAVVGATGAIGAICSELLADRVGRLVLVGRREHAVERLVQRLGGRGAMVEGDLDVAKLGEADIIISATSSLAAVIRQEYLKLGAIVCDIAQPPDVSAGVRRLRKDVVVIDGGLVRVPGQVDFHFDLGLGPGLAYACMAETMILALEGRYESFTLGKHITGERVAVIRSLAEKHGFRPDYMHGSELLRGDGQEEQIRERTPAYAGKTVGGRS